MASWTKVDDRWVLKVTGKERLLSPGDTVTVKKKDRTIQTVTLGDRLVNGFFLPYQEGAKSDPDRASEQRYFGFASDGERLNHRSDPYDPYDR